MDRLLVTAAAGLPAWIVVAALALSLSNCTSTRPFTDHSGRPVPGSVARIETITLGGVRQSVWFRGRDVRAPVLILLHGGPGASESALFRHYDAALESRFVVVYWEQRGAGRSYGSGLKRSSMTIARMVDDLDELVDTVRVRFPTSDIVLLGHSWGTVLGTLYARDHPEKIAAYVGVAQIADFARGERTSLAWALRQAEERHDRRGGLGDMALKRRLEEVLQESLAPIRERRARFAADPAGVVALLREGTARTRARASVVVRDVREVFALDDPHDRA